MALPVTTAPKSSEIYEGVNFESRRKRPKEGMTQMSQSTQSPETIQKAVRERYGSVAQLVLTGDAQAGCCGGSSASSCCGGEETPGVAAQYYASSETDELPEEAVLASLGCGNPIALARLEPGQVVLDLGSGGGIDVLLSAKRVGPEGYVYGLDMTDEMLELAERNRQSAGATNVTFLKGQIEDVLLPDASVDVIISNCVINLAADKTAVFREAFRVLRPGGYLAVSDIVVQGQLDPALRSDLDSWAGCVGGALEEQEYLGGLASVGFVDSSIEVTSVVDLAEAGDCCGGSDVAASDSAAGRVVSGFVRASKPVA